jgi:hypothetical protein
LGPEGLFRLPQRCARWLHLPRPGQIEGAHEGYGEVHERRFTLNAGSLVIVDRCRVPYPRQLRFNLDPSIVPRLSSTGDYPRVDLCHGRQHVTLEVRGATGVTIDDGCFSAGFGVPVPTRALSFALGREEVVTMMTWS